MADDLETYLNELPDKLHQQVSDAVLKQAFRLSDAQREALQELEQSAESGAMEASCTVAPGANDLEYIVQTGGDMTTKEIRDGSGVPYDYAEAFEFGTSRQEARPFFWPTYRAMKDDIEQEIQNAISEALN
jgi:HK97 gp10 family phage protein